MKTYRFPENFIWGSASSAYQIEGAIHEGGRGETMYDRYIMTPGTITNNDTAEVACDFYHKWKEDIALMKKLGQKAYRFSIAWSRILPMGTGEVNEEGIKFYSDVIDELLANDIEPFPTLYHYDLPQALQEQGGWVNDASVQWFENYAKILFERYGDRVKYWLTINEPVCCTFYAYFEGWHAPGHRDLGAGIRSSYNLMRAHGAAVRLYHSMNLGGRIGLVLNIVPSIPASDKEEDIKACHIHNGYKNRWFMDAALKGKFPEDMVELYKSKTVLPDFSDAALMAEPADFLGINYYNTEMVRYNPNSWPFCVETIHDTTRPVTGVGWNINPDGLRKVLVHLKEEYGVENIIITENGASFNDLVTLDGKVHDPYRIDYFQRHLIAIHEAMEQGVNVEGYLAWCFMDNFEWLLGYTARFGIVYHDKDTLERIPKDSAWWFKEVIENNGFDVPEKE